MRPVREVQLRPVFFQTSFNVVYEASQGKFNYDLSIAMGTLCSLAAVFAMLRTWGWSRRAGKLTVEIMMIIKFLMFCFGAIANIFFIVSFGAAFWFLTFYKVNVLHNLSQNSTSTANSKMDIVCDKNDCYYSF